MPRATETGRARAGVVRVIRQIFGMPDYERYLEHRAACHPNDPPLSREEYFAQQVERRYGAGQSRCC